MGRELGRISGPLLADNLKRNGVDLAFETRLLYLNVTGTRIGVNTLSPAYELDVNDSFRTSNLNVITQATIANLEFYTNNIQNVVGNIVISPNQTTDPVIAVPQLQVSSLLFSGNTLSNTVADSDIIVGLDPSNISAQIKLNNNTIVSADLHATGNITFDGNITLGNDQSEDTVYFGSRVNSAIVPDADNTYDLGSASATWATAYVYETNSTIFGIADATTTTLTGSGTALLNGNVVIGTSANNTLSVSARINTSLIPSVTDTYNLGSAIGPKYWNNVYGVTLDNNDITVTGNTIQTTNTDSSLRLVANGVGQVVFSKLDVTNNFTAGTLRVTGASTLTDTTAGAITQTGNFVLTGDTDITGDLSSANITQTGSSVSFQLPGITIADSNIDSTTVDTDLQITANSSRKIVISATDAQFDQNLSVGQTLTVNSITSLTNTSAGAVALTGDYNLTGNFSTTGSISSGNIISDAPLVLPSLILSGVTGTDATTTYTQDVDYSAGAVVYLGSGFNAISIDSARFTNMVAFDNLVERLLGQAWTISSSGVNTVTVTQTSSWSNYYPGAKIVGVSPQPYVSSNWSSGVNNITSITYTDLLVSAASAIVGINTNTDLVLTAKAGQQVNITSSADINGDLSVGQTLDVTSTSTLASTITGAITLVGDYNQTGNFVTTGEISSGSISSDNPLTLPNITIDGTVITGTVADTALTLSPNTGTVANITSDVEIDDDLIVTGTLSVTDVSTLTNTTVGAITQTGDYDLTGNADVTGNASGSNITANGTNSILQLPDITISGSTIASTATDTDVQITANGTGKISIPTANVQVDQDLSVTGTFTNSSGNIAVGTITTGDIKQTGIFDQDGNTSITGSVSANNLTSTGLASKLDLANFRIAGQTITSNITDGTINFTGASAGGVRVGNYLKISGNRLINDWTNGVVFYTTEDLQVLLTEDADPIYIETGAALDLPSSITLTPTGTGNVVINSNKALTLPLANNSDEVLDTTGSIRYNNVNNNIEGFSNTGNVNFINLYSESYNTFVTPELAPNTGDNLLRFGIAGNVTTTISSTAVVNDNLVTDNVSVSLNIIRNIDASDDFNITATGTGRVKFNSVNFVNGSDFYVPTNDAITFANTGQGYVKFSGTAGVVVPYGTPSNYPLNPELGAIRVSTVTSYLEVYDGTNWVPAAGANNALTETEISDLVQVYTIVLGF